VRASASSPLPACPWPQHSQIVTAPFAGAPVASASCLTRSGDEVFPSGKLLGSPALKFRRFRAVWVCIVVGVLAGLAGCGEADGSAPTYETRFDDFDRQSDQPLIVPVLPPVGYALSPALDTRTWVPTGFQSGRVPTMTLCVLGEEMNPAGVCFGTDDSDRVRIEESIVEGHRLVLVASPGDGFTAAEMLADWHGAAFTSAWEDLGWLDEASDTSR